MKHSKPFLKHLYILISLIILQSCNLKKTQYDDSSDSTLKPAYKTSALTRAFNADLEKELSQSKVIDTNSILIKKYGLIVIGDTVNIQGRFDLKEGADIAEIMDLGTIRKMGNSYNIILPIENIYSFYAIESISYFEISVLTNLLEK